MCSIVMDIESGESEDAEHCSTANMLKCVLILVIVGLVVASWF